MWCGLKALVANIQLVLNTQHSATEVTQYLSDQIVDNSTVALELKPQEC